VDDETDREEQLQWLEYELRTERQRRKSLDDQVVALWLIAVAAIAVAFALRRPWFGESWWEVVLSVAVLLFVAWFCAAMLFLVLCPIVGWAREAWSDRREAWSDRGRKRVKIGDVKIGDIVYPAPERLRDSPTPPDLGSLPPQHPDDPPRS
jgi:hypothetical protein